LGLSEFLRELAEEVHIVARVAASGETAQPERVLDRFLSLASSFESERGPSLHGFLHRLDALESSGRLEGGSLEPNRRGVQVMTIHKSKGLEFPVVVVPQLEWRFSSKDRLASRIRIGPRWVGVRQFDEATYSRREANGRKVLEWIQEQEAREEESRVLYVALTRARDRLLLFAADRFNPDKAEELPPLLSARRKQTAFDRIRWFKEGLPWTERVECDPVELEREGLNPRTELTWEDLVERDRKKGGTLLGVTADTPKGSIEPAREWTLDRPRMSIRWIPKARLVASLSSPDGVEESSDSDADHLQQKSEIRAALVSAFESQDPGKSLALPRLPGASSNQEANETLDRVLLRAGVPPIARIDGLRGKYWVTEFKSADDRRRRAALEEEGTQLWGPFVPRAATGEESSGQREGGPGATEQGTIEEGATVLDPAVAGVRYHQALALLDLSRISAQQLDSQFEEFSRTTWWDAHPRDEVLEQGIVDFFLSDLGRELSLAAAEGRVEREVSFSLKWSAADLRRYAPDLDLEPDPRWSREEWERELEQTWVLLQGRIDCVFGTEEGWVVVDWKTDRVEREAVGERMKSYRSQMELYREAVSRLWGSPTRVTVAFLRPRMMIPLEQAEPPPD
jgi:ATP-dependent helicase/nuclease subunit A